MSRQAINLDGRAFVTGITMHYNTSPNIQFCGYNRNYM
jgi:hypothetical protein